MNVDVPTSEQGQPDSPPVAPRSRRRWSTLVGTAVAVAVVGAVIVATGSNPIDRGKNVALTTPDQVVTSWELVGSLPDGAEFARVAGDRIVAFGRTDESMDMWLLADDGGWVAFDLPAGTRHVDVAGEGDVIVVAAVGDDVSLTLIEPVRIHRPWVAVDGDRVISLRLVEMVVEAVVDTPDGTMRVTMPDGWASLDPADWDVTPTVVPFTRTPVFLEYFDDGLIVGTERIGGESLPGRVIVSTDDGTTWTEFDLGAVSDFGSVGGVPVVIGGTGPVVYRVDPGPPVTLVATDAGDVFEHPPWPWAGGLADLLDPTDPAYTYLPSLDADPELIRWEESGIDGQLLGFTREGLATTIDDDTGERFLYRWRGMSTGP